MSIDFLSHLSLGPVRARFSIHDIRRLPVAIEPRLVAFLTPELLEQAKQIRLSLAGLPERVHQPPCARSFGRGAAQERPQ